MNKPEKVPFYFQVYNTAAHEQVRFERVELAGFLEALDHKKELEREYGQIGCHEVKAFMELFAE
ncbi:MAG: hypothetical protein QXJ74_06120 [Nitrososphaera sp.]